MSKCHDGFCDGNQSAGGFCRVGLYIFNAGHFEDKISPCKITANQVAYSLRNIGFNV